MTTKVGSGRAGLGGLAVVAVLLAVGCERTGQQAGPTTTVPVPVLSGESSTTTVPATPAGPTERRPQPVSFLVRAESCAAFVNAIRPVALEAVGPWGFGSGAYVNGGVAGRASGPMTMDAAAPTAAAAPGTTQAGGGAEFSATNVQAAGVDEPDLVKTDGRLLVTTADGRLRVVDVTGSPRQVGALDLPDGGGDLLLVGRRALVLSGGGGPGPGPMSKGRPGTMVAPGPSGSGVARPTTTITVVDLADPARPTVARTHTIDGALVDARLVGGVARVVTRSMPNISFPQVTPNDQGRADQATAANAAIVEKAGAAAFLAKGAACADAYVPAEGAGMGAIAVQSLDPAADAPGPAVTVMADATTVYASGSTLFVATNRYHGGGGVVNPAQAGPGAAPASPRTAIHAFDITDPAKARYAGSGDVPGRLLNSFSLSEDGGALRVATTLDGFSGGFIGGSAGGVAAPTPPGQGKPEQQAPSQSRVTILRRAGQEWVETGAVDGLGRGERIYAVRFLGPTGYVVTFRQVDPLYVLDLRDIRAPKLTGELKITGYSAYLHPAGDGRLLGIGQEATEQGRRAGTQLSLFDVGNPAAPAKLAGTVLPSASSSAEEDHHAFLFWPATGLVVAPVRSYGGGPAVPATASRPFVGAVAFRVGDKSVAEAGRITHPGSTPIDRSIVVGDRLLTLSSVGLATNDLHSLADGGFLAFR